MTESIIATFDDVKFVEGVTKMTQNNWQKYFKSAIPNGVYSGLEFKKIGSGSKYYHFMDGVAFVNGMMAEISTPDGYTDLGAITPSENDAFFCLRIYFDREQAELIQKTDIYLDIPYWGTLSEPNYYKYMNTLGYLEKFEDYECERNLTYYEIPLFYIVSGWSYGPLTDGIDLRRMVKPDQARALNPQVPCIYRNSFALLSSNNLYMLTGGMTVMTFYIDAINLPNDAIIVNNTGSNVTVQIITDHYCGDLIDLDSTVPSLYADIYTYSRGLVRHTLLIKSGITHSSYTSSTGYKCKGEAITLGANQALHITYVSSEAYGSGDVYAYSYKFLVE